jgi:amicyanin
VVLVGGVLAAVALGGKDSSDMDMDDMKPSNTSQNNSSTNAANAVATDQVEIENYSFTPAVIKVKVGTKVTWTNKDSVQHNIVADTASPDAPDGDLIAKGESYSFTFNKAGTYTYHCSPHPYMKATVIVTE